MSIVKLRYYQPEIAIVSLENIEHHNTFSPDMIDGLLNVFEIINTDNVVKVVIIHGYENYFCCGGTKEMLLRINAGEITFAELDFFSILLDCKIPTIAAMQGHALGGGFTFGCYADFILLAEESLYSANFMKYGFTPGVGATYIIPKKIGEGLAREMLFTAKNYHGVTLKERGALVEVIKKADVIPSAIKLATEIAKKPRLSLIELKKHLTNQIRKDLPGIIEQEVAMHNITFVQAGVKESIEALFGN